MRIFVFGTRGFPDIQGGVEKHCEYLYPLLASQFEITVFRRKAYITKRVGVEYSTIRFIDLASTRIKGLEAFFHSFLCTVYCIVKRPDVIHVHNIGPGMFIPLLKLFGLKVVLTYHSPNYEHNKWGIIAKKILKASEWLSTRWADKIIFVNITRKELFNNKIQQKSVVIPNGVNLVSRSTDTEYVSEIGLEPGKYILAVGRITQEKGFDYLIEAYLQSDFTADYKLVLAGGIDHTSYYANNIVKKAKAYPNIIIPGYVDGERLRQLYSHAALFIIPSYNEGFPLVLLEAMNYNLPILASNIPANKLVGLSNSDYFATGVTESLTRHINMKINENKQFYMYDLTPYNWKNIAKQTAGIYESIMA